jgi:DNA-binding transcriptional LysR family regulator
MPPIFIATDLAEGRLVTVLDQWAPTPPIGFFLYYPSRRQMRPALKALVNFLGEERRGAPRELRLQPTARRDDSPVLEAEEAKRK